MKKKYSKPEMRVVMLKRRTALLVGSCSGEPKELEGTQEEYLELGYMPGTTGGTSILA